MRIPFHFFVCTSTLATSVSSISLRKFDHRNLPSCPKSDDLDLSAQQATTGICRRSCMTSLFGAFALSAGGRLAYAADKDSDTFCTTGCMYTCQAQLMENKDRSMTSNRVVSECQEQCQGEKAACHAKPPQRKQEPKLAQSKKIKILYPRWQDDF